PLVELVERPRGDGAILAGRRRDEAGKEERAPARERVAGVQADERLEQRAARRGHDPGSGPNAGGGTRRFDAASYAEAILRITSSFPGSQRNTSENGRPGAGIVVGVVA